MLSYVTYLWSCNRQKTISENWFLNTVIFFVFHHKIEGKASYVTLTLFYWVNLFLLHVVGSNSFFTPRCWVEKPFLPYCYWDIIPFLPPFCRVNIDFYPSLLGRKAIFTPCYWDKSPVLSSFTPFYWDYFFVKRVEKCDLLSNK